MRKNARFNTQMLVLDNEDTVRIENVGTSTFIELEVDTSDGRTSSVLLVPSEALWLAEKLIAFVRTSRR